MIKRHASGEISLGGKWLGLGLAKRNLRPKRGGYPRDGVGELGLYKLNPRAPFELC